MLIELSKEQIECLMFALEPDDIYLDDDFGDELRYILEKALEACEDE